MAARKSELILKKVARNATRAELTELADLKRLSGARRDLLAPLPIEEARALYGGSRETGVAAPILMKPCARPTHSLLLMRRMLEDTGLKATRITGSIGSGCGTSSAFVVSFASGGNVGLKPKVNLTSITYCRDQVTLI